MTGIVRGCGSRCPRMPASFRSFHTNAANQELLHNSLNLHATKYREVNFHFTEALKGIPIGNHDQLNDVAFWSGMACQN